MTLRQQIRSRFLIILKHTLNPLTRRMARTNVGPFAIVQHVGRRSGKHYETPIILGVAENSFVVELTYGPDVDWYKNVQAAGGCAILWHGRVYQIDHMEPLDAETGRMAFPRLARLALHVMNMQHFVRMTVRSSRLTPESSEET